MTCMHSELHAGLIKVCINVGKPLLFISILKIAGSSGQRQSEIHDSPVQRSELGPQAKVEVRAPDNARRQHIGAVVGRRAGCGGHQAQVQRPIHRDFEACMRKKHPSIACAERCMPSEGWQCTARPHVSPR